MPFVVSLYDSFRLQESQSRSDVDPLDGDPNETAFDVVQRRCLGLRYRYVLPTFVITLGCHLTSGLWAGLSSTYICPLVVGQTRTVPFMQFIIAVLDCHLAITASELCLRKSSRGEKQGESAALVWGAILLVRVNRNEGPAPYADPLCNRQLRPYGLSLASLYSSQNQSIEIGSFLFAYYSTSTTYSLFCGNFFLWPLFVYARPIV